MIGNTKIKELFISKLMLCMCISYSIFLGITILICILNVAISQSPVKILMVSLIYLLFEIFLCSNLWLIYISGRNDKISKCGIVVIQVYVVIIALLFALLLGMAMVVVSVGGVMVTAFANVMESSLVMMISMLIISGGLAIGIGLMYVVAIGSSETIILLRHIKCNYNDYSQIKFQTIKVFVLINLLLALGMLVHQISEVIVQVTFHGMGKVFLNESNLLSFWGLRIRPTLVIALINILGLGGAIIYVLFLMVAFKCVSVSNKVLVDEVLISEDVGEHNKIAQLEEGSFNNSQIVQDEFVDNHIEYKFELFQQKGIITCIYGNEEGISYPVSHEEEVIIGKDPLVSNIVMSKAYKQVSRKHCGIKYNAEKDVYMVIDYSTNGTFVDGKRLTKGMYATLPRGKIITLSKEILKYRLD